MFWWGFGCEVVGGVGDGGAAGLFGSGGGFDTVVVVRFVEIYRFHVYLVDLYCVSVDCLEELCELRHVVPSTFGSRSCILIGRSLLIRDRELVSSGVFMG
ncbi:hypothetical protein A2U01_0005805 [Trifolium medium]|uniref:Uncharacterized protein n=1 Tax=Trifolium medium TaxID=97028 RepID=A0A392MBS3_9FABA|nr:hypothetical protein [Trifolium medium]